jgi:hypothetical protein
VCSIGVECRFSRSSFFSKGIVGHGLIKRRVAANGWSMEDDLTVHVSVAELLKVDMFHVLKFNAPNHTIRQTLPLRHEDYPDLMSSSSLSSSNNTNPDDLDGFGEDFAELEAMSASIQSKFVSLSIVYMHHFLTTTTTTTTTTTKHHSIVRINRDHWHRRHLAGQRSHKAVSRVNNNCNNNNNNRRHNTHPLVIYRSQVAPIHVLYRLASIPLP